MRTTCSRIVTSPHSWGYTAPLSTRSLWFSTPPRNILTWPNTSETNLAQVKCNWYRLPFLLRSHLFIAEPWIFLMSGHWNCARPVSHARFGRCPWESGERELLRVMPLSPYHTFTPTFLQTNVLVGSDGVPRIAGLGSAFIPSFPVAWLEEPSELTRCSAPELVNPETLGLLKAQTAKESDMYSFGVLAYEVRHLPIPISKCG
jgi:hypothetical protein